MLRTTLKAAEEDTSHGGIVYEPKLTRSKMKEVLEKGKVGWCWYLVERWLLVDLHACKDAICEHMHTHIHINTHTGALTQMHICVHMGTNIRTHTHTSAFRFTRGHAHTSCTCMCAHMHTLTHTCMHSHRHTYTDTMHPQAYMRICIHLLYAYIYCTNIYDVANLKPTVYHYH